MKAEVQDFVGWCKLFVIRVCEAENVMRNHVCETVCVNILAPLPHLVMAAPGSGGHWCFSLAPQRPLHHRVRLWFWFYNWFWNCCCFWSTNHQNHFSYTIVLLILILMKKRIKEWFSEWRKMWRKEWMKEGRKRMRHWGWTFIAALM